MEAGKVTEKRMTFPLRATVVSQEKLKRSLRISVKANVDIKLVFSS